MKRRSKVALIAVVAFVAFSFLAPVVHWYTVDSPVVTIPYVPHPLFAVYRSLSCVTLGFGVSLQAEGVQSELYLTCDPPIMLPA